MMAKEKKESKEMKIKIHIPFIFIIIVVVILLILFGSGLGFGLGKGSGEGEGKGGLRSSINAIESSSQDDSIAKEKDKVEDIEKALETSGQNNNAVDDSEGAVEKITVVENEYFHDNERISLEEFLSEIKGSAEDLIVEITDDNASLDAYENLTDELDKEHFDYKEN